MNNVIRTVFKGGTEMKTYFATEELAKECLNELNRRKYRQYDAVYFLEEEIILDEEVKKWK